MRMPPHRHTRNCSWHFVYTFFVATFSSLFDIYMLPFFVRLLHFLFSVLSNRIAHEHFNVISLTRLTHTHICETDDDLQWQRRQLELESQLAERLSGKAVFNIVCTVLSVLSFSSFYLHNSGERSETEKKGSNLCFYSY